MKLMTVREVAVILQVSYETALRLVKREMRNIRIGRQYLVSEQALAQYIRTLERRGSGR